MFATLNPPHPDYSEFTLENLENLDYVYLPAEFGEFSKTRRTFRIENARFRRSDKRLLMEVDENLSEGIQGKLDTDEYEFEQRVPINTSSGSLRVTRTEFSDIFPDTYEPRSGTRSFESFPASFEADITFKIRRLYRPEDKTLFFHILIDRMEITQPQDTVHPIDPSFGVMG